jgi:hypothetical protein
MKCFIAEDLNELAREFNINRYYALREMFWVSS